MVCYGDYYVRCGVNFWQLVLPVQHLFVFCWQFAVDLVRIYVARMASDYYEFICHNNISHRIRH
jgi:hypothetical protein